MDSVSGKGSAFAVAALLLCVAVAVVASVALLVQHRKMDELRRDFENRRRLSEKVLEERRGLLSANGRLVDEAAKLRASLGKCESRVGALERELSVAKEEAKFVAVARDRAEAEVKRLAAAVEATVKSVDKLIMERSSLKRSLDEAVKKAAKTAKPAVAAKIAERDERLSSHLTLPPQDKLTPKEREMRSKTELDELIGL